MTAHNRNNHMNDRNVTITKGNKGNNYLAVGGSLLHATGIEAVMMQLEKRGVEMKGIILLLAHQITGPLLTQNSFCHVPKGTEIRELTSAELGHGNLFKLRYWIRALIKARKDNYYYENDVFYVISPRVDALWYSIAGRYCANKKIVFILIEDGLDTYNNDQMQNIFRYEYFKNGSGRIKRIKAAVSAIVRVVLIKTFTKVLIKQNALLQGTVFKKHDERGRFTIRTNEKVVPFYRVAFKNRGNRIDDKELEQFRGSVLISTEPFMENGITDGNADYEVYQQLVEELRKRDVNIVIKTHPREKNIEKYRQLKCDLFTDATISQEEILANLERLPICVISFFSATLLYARGIFGIPAISMARVLKEKEISITLRNELSEFMNEYRSVVIFPKSIEQISLIVDRLIKKQKMEFA